MMFWWRVHGAYEALHAYWSVNVCIDVCIVYMHLCACAKNPGQFNSTGWCSWVPLPLPWTCIQPGKNSRLDQTTALYNQSVPPSPVAAAVATDPSVCVLSDTHTHRDAQIHRHGTHIPALLYAELHQYIAYGSHFAKVWASYLSAISNFPWREAT